MADLLCPPVGGGRGLAALSPNQGAAMELWSSLDDRVSVRYRS